MFPYCVSLPNLSTYVSCLPVPFGCLLFIILLISQPWEVQVGEEREWAWRRKAGVETSGGRGGGGTISKDVSKNSSARLMIALLAAALMEFTHFTKILC